MKNKLIAAIHAAIVVAAYSSPFWLNWQLMALGVVIYWLQIAVFKACVLTIAEFGTTNISFVGMYAEKILSNFEIEIDQHKVKIFLDWVLPPSLLAIAYAIQT